MTAVDSTLGKMVGRVANSHESENKALEVLPNRESHVATNISVSFIQPQISLGHFKYINPRDRNARCSTISPGIFSDKVCTFLTL